MNSVEIDEKGLLNSIESHLETEEYNEYEEYYAFNEIDYEDRDYEDVDFDDLNNLNE